MLNEIEPVARLSRDIAKAGATLCDAEARFLVDSYYQMQDARIRAGNQVGALAKAGEPNGVLEWLAKQNETLEKQLVRALDRYTDEIPAGRWAKTQKGVGPVIAAGLCANIGDATRFASAGNLFSYCGLAPGQRRKKGERANWSAALKRLAWVMGECFVKVSGHDDALYGRLYKEKKRYYMEKNEAGGFADRAAQCLAERKYGKDTEAFKAYSVGKLPKAHIHAMATRFAAKMFIAHFWEVSLMAAGREVPQPYAIAILGHVHRVQPSDE